MGLLLCNFKIIIQNKCLSSCEISSDIYVCVYETAHPRKCNQTIQIKTSTEVICILESNSFFSHLFSVYQPWLDSKILWKNILSSPLPIFYKHIPIKLLPESLMMTTFHFHHCCHSFLSIITSHWSHQFARLYPSLCAV